MTRVKSLDIAEEGLLAAASRSTKGACAGGETMGARELSGLLSDGRWRF
jgi:hypothetical protein